MYEGFGNKSTKVLKQDLVWTFEDFGLLVADVMKTGGRFDVAVDGKTVEFVAVTLELEALGNIHLGTRFLPLVVEKSVFEKILERKLQK